MEARGVKASLLILVFLCLFSNLSFSNNITNAQTSNIECAYGSHKELYKFFTAEKYAVIAQGKRIQANGDIKDFADVLFLLSPDMTYFHAITLAGVEYDYFKACIHSSAREVDFQFASPIPELLQRKNREHLVFLVKNLPKDSSCPTHNNSCITWSEWSPLLEQTFLFSAYAFASDAENDPYNELVELTLDNKKIRPTRGVLTEHARVKYALRLRNELNESAHDLKAAKDAYKQIHDEVDHKLPLIFLSVSQDRTWRITEINRNNGLAETILHGVELQLYPMKQEEYKKLLMQ